MSNENKLKKLITYNDIICYGGYYDGAVLCSTDVGRNWVKMRYYGYTKKQAIKSFYHYINSREYLKYI